MNGLNKREVKANVHASGNGNGNGNGHHHHSHLRSLRKKKGISQRALARKTGIEQSQLSRLETKTWKDIDLGSATLLTQGLGCGLEELIPGFSTQKKTESISFSSLRKPFLTIDYQKEVQITSFTKPDASRFMGSLTLGPLKTIAKDQTPCAAAVFYFVHRGSLILTCDGEERDLLEGQTVMLNQNNLYTLRNPDPGRDLTLLLISIPSFIQFNS